MSGIAGCIDSFRNFSANQEKKSIFVRKGGEIREYEIVFTGEIYNGKEIESELKQFGHTFLTRSDREIVASAYAEYGEQCASHLNGVFGFVIWDKKNKNCFLARDRFGVKSLFYAEKEGGLYFASKIRDLFQYTGDEAVIDKTGLCEVFGLGPARSAGNGVYKGVRELEPGHFMQIDGGGRKVVRYWNVIAEEHRDSYAETVEKTRYLLLDSIHRRLSCSTPVSAMLSGGIDSSIVAAVAAEELKKQGGRLHTYSFDYKDNSKFFKASSFQPSEDRPYVDIMVEAIGSEHTYLECNSKDLVDCLTDAVTAKDLPGMADVDSSLFYFCREIKKMHSICLSGECSDEIFGGYPWFRDFDAEKRAFPWSKNFDFRKEILSEEVLSQLPLEAYVQEQYDKTIKEVPKLNLDSRQVQDQREIQYLNIKWFMRTLLERMVMGGGLEVRVPFADHRLVEYLYNVPWEYKYHDNTVKGLLRDAVKGLVPESVLYRKKSPYPKTYDPSYENRLKEKLKKILADQHAPIQRLIHRQNIEMRMNEASDLGRPWFGQLMAVPQMYAYLIEINDWLIRYQIRIEL